MALHIIDEPSFGGRLGTAVGSGLSGLMENLVQSKAKQVQQNQRALGYEKGFGLNPEAAKTLASQPEEFQQQAFKALLESQQYEQLQRQINPGQFQAPMQALGGMGQQQGPSLEQSMGALGGNQEPQDAILQNLAKILPQLQQEGALGQQAMLPQETPAQGGPQMAPQEQEGQGLGDVFRNKPLNPKLALEAQKIQEGRSQRAEKSVQESYKYNKDTIAKARESAKRAEQDNQVLEQILKANKSGKLFQGPTRKLLEKIGLEDVVTNTPTQFVAKHIERFLTGAPTKFGTGRFTNFLAEAYQKGNLRLVNSKDAMDLIGKTIILENKKEEAYYKAMRDIEKQSSQKGRPLPYDLADQALERAKPQFEKYDNEAMQTLEKVLAGGRQSSFESLPKAADYSGKTITDTQTGKKYKSNGSKWVKA